MNDHISDEDWNSLAEGDEVILLRNLTKAKVLKTYNGLSIKVKTDVKLRGCAIYYQFEVKQKL